MKRGKELSALHQALLRHDLAAVRAALQRKDDVDGADRDGRTPLTIAAMQGDSAIAAVLLAAGANPNATDKTLDTPLHFAAREYQVECAELLLRHGAKVDAANAHGNTPLFDAVYESAGRGQMITLLRSHGADPQRKNQYGVSPAELADSIANFDARQFLR